MFFYTYCIRWYKKLHKKPIRSQVIEQLKIHYWPFSIHSLPVGCKFSIILFGARYESVFGYKGLVEYNEANLLRAERAVNNLKANMGGTNLLGPLETAYEQCESKSKKGNVAQIFLLTDGEIHDTETVFKLVSKNRTKSRIFSIGIGKD